MGDAVGCAVTGQSSPNGYYNIERMLQSTLRKGVTVHMCTACTEARGVEKSEFVGGCEVGSMKSLARWTLAADKVINY
jgi:uncharacterized protein involved in oxidation of intracellular sulfur